MTTKKQHYYPRCLLKFFANEEKVNVFIRQANKKSKMNYEKVCAQNYTYESEDDVDNILENKLSHYESRIEKIVDYIVKNFNPLTSCSSLSINQDEQQFILQYMWLQYLRTDAGRINYITYIENNKSYVSRTGPIELTEIKDNKEKIKRFNKIFKQGCNLEHLINSIKKPDTMNFHVAWSQENLLTSDNPVIITDNWKQIILPISPNICIEFQDDSINCSNDLEVILTSEKTRYLNEATINTANYYVISKQPFNVTQDMYIYNRFNNENWKIGEPHSPKL